MSQQPPPPTALIVQALYERHVALAEGVNEQRTVLTRKIAEQLRYTLGPGWGHKRASATRPPSKDAFAQRQPNGHLWIWDWQDGTTRKPLAAFSFHDVTDQVFIQVDPIDHLGGSAPPPPVPPPPASDLEARVLALEHEVSRVTTILRSV